jgi:hypothetical protein
MSKQSRNKLPIGWVDNRPGEGVFLDAVVDTFVGTDGNTIAQMGINLAAADVPDRKYYADICGISSRRGTVNLMFGQEKVDESGLRSLLVVQMSEFAVGRLLATIDDVKSPTFQEQATAINLPTELLTEKIAEPPQAIALPANIVLCAAAGNEACADFYMASPFALGNVMKSKRLALDPVVRVNLRSTLFLSMLDGLRKLGIAPQKIFHRSDKP